MIGDAKFIGWNTTRDPGLLDPGVVSGGDGFRIDRGMAVSRPGITKPSWLARVGQAFPLEFPLNFRQINALGPLHAIEEFDDPNGAPRVIAVGEDESYDFRRGQTLKSLEMPESVSARARIVQAFNRLFLFRGADLEPWELDMRNRCWKPITQLDIDGEEGTGAETIPNAELSIYYRNRLVMPYDRDRLAISNALNYTKYRLANSERINQGQGGEITGLAPWVDNTILIFFRNRIYYLTNLIPDDVGDFSSARLELLTSRYGGWHDSIIEAGQDTYFLSERGITSVKLTELNRAQNRVETLSWPIQNIIDRINWEVADRAQAAMIRNELVWALPLDHAEYPNALVSYDLINQAWNAPVLKNVSVRQFFTMSWRREKIVAWADDEGRMNQLDNGATHDEVVTTKEYDETLLRLNEKPDDGVFVQVGQNTENGALYRLRFADTFSEIGNGPGWRIDTVKGRHLAVYDEQYLNQVAKFETPSAPGQVIKVVTILRSNTIGQLYPLIEAAIEYLKNVINGASPGRYSAALTAYGDDTDEGHVRMYGAALPRIFPESHQEAFYMYHDGGTAPRVTDIPHEFVSRGYKAEEGLLRVRRVHIEMETYDAEIEVAIMRDGKSEDAYSSTYKFYDMENVTRPFNAARWDSTNRSNDFDNPYRESYAVRLPDAGMNIDSGVPLSEFQACRLVIQRHIVAQFLQVKVIVRKGMVKIKSIQLEATGARARGGVDR